MAHGLCRAVGKIGEWADGECESEIRSTYRKQSEITRDRPIGCIATSIGEVWLEEEIVRCTARHPHLRRTVGAIICDGHCVLDHLSPIGCPWSLHSDDKIGASSRDAQWNPEESNERRKPDNEGTGKH